uniref:Uncharacterized protein n=2 Tax=Cacopsylla melanoneura TaxID=428564 RepID=A0A8D8ZW47_9HEMI
MPENKNYSPKRTDSINLVCAHKIDSTSNQTNTQSNDIDTNKSPTSRTARKYTRTKPLDRQKSLPEFSSNAASTSNNTACFLRGGENRAYDQSPYKDKSKLTHQTNEKPSYTKNLSAKTSQYDAKKIERQKTVPGFSRISKPDTTSTYEQGPYETDKFSHQTKTSQTKDNINMRKFGPKKFERQKTMPEFNRTSRPEPEFSRTSRPDPEFSKTSRPDLNVGKINKNNPSLSPNATHYLNRQNPLSETYNVTNSLNQSTQPNSLSYKGILPLNNFVGTTSTAPKSSKPFPRQKSLPETFLRPNSINRNFNEAGTTRGSENVPLSISSDIQNRKQKVENDTLDLNARMRRQKAESRAKGTTSNWNPSVDTKSYSNISNTPGPSMHTDTLSNRPTISNSSNDNSKSTTFTNKPRQMCNVFDKGASATPEISRKPTSTLNRTQGERSNPNRRFSVDSVTSRNTVSGGAPSASVGPPKTNNWEDEARNQVWRGYIQTMKNLDGF